MEVRCSQGPAVGEPVPLDSTTQNSDRPVPGAPCLDPWTETLLQGRPVGAGVGGVWRGLPEEETNSRPTREKMPSPSCVGWAPMACAGSAQGWGAQGPAGAVLVGRELESLENNVESSGEAEVRHSPSDQKSCF